MEWLDSTPTKGEGVLKREPWEVLCTLSKASPIDEARSSCTVSCPQGIMMTLTNVLESRMQAKTFRAQLQPSS